MRICRCYTAACLLCSVCNIVVCAVIRNNHSLAVKGLQNRRGQRNRGICECDLRRIRRRRECCCRIRPISCNCEGQRTAVVINIGAVGNGAVGNQYLHSVFLTHVHGCRKSESQCFSINCGGFDLCNFLSVGIVDSSDSVSRKIIDAAHYCNYKISRFNAVRLCVRRNIECRIFCNCECYLNTDRHLCSDICRSGHIDRGLIICRSATKCTGKYICCACFDCESIFIGSSNIYCSNCCSVSGDLTGEITGSRSKDNRSLGDRDCSGSVSGNCRYFSIGFIIEYHIADVCQSESDQRGKFTVI